MGLLKARMSEKHGEQKLHNTSQPHSDKGKGATDHQRAPLGAGNQADPGTLHDSQRPSRAHVSGNDDGKQKGIEFQYCIPLNIGMHVLTLF